MAMRLAQRRIRPAHVIAWSLWRRAHQAAAQQRTSGADRNCNARQRATGGAHFVGAVIGRDGECPTLEQGKEGSSEGTDTHEEEHARPLDPGQMK